MLNTNLKWYPYNIFNIIKYLFHDFYLQNLYTKEENLLTDAFIDWFVCWQLSKRKQIRQLISNWRVGFVTFLTFTQSIFEFLECFWIPVGDRELTGCGESNLVFRKGVCGVSCLVCQVRFYQILMVIIAAHVLTNWSSTLPIISLTTHNAFHVLACCERSLHSFRLDAFLLLHYLC